MNVFIGLSIMAFVSLLVYTFITALLGIVVVIIAGTIVVNTKTKLSVSDTVFMQVNKTDYKVTFPTVVLSPDFIGAFFIRKTLIDKEFQRIVFSFHFL